MALTDQEQVNMVKKQALAIAKTSMKRVSFSADQKKRSQLAFDATEKLLEIYFDTAMPCEALRMACQHLESATMWHSKAIANESKS